MSAQKSKCFRVPVRYSIAKSAYENILKRYLFHLAPYLKQSILFPGNFIQIESEPTENGFLLEINTSLRGILSPCQRLCPRNLKSSTCLCLQFLKEKSKLRKKERYSRHSQGSNREHWLKNRQAICLNHLRVDECRWEKIAQVISVIACTDYRYKRRSGKRSLCTDEKKKHILAKCQNSYKLMSWSIS